MWRRRTLDAQQLRRHLDGTIDAIRRHRSRIQRGGIGYTDTPTFGGFGPKSPCNDGAMDLADSEAASLGNIALTCMRRGTIPPVGLRPLWFTNRGKCIGLRIIGHDEDEFDMWGNHTGADYLDPLFPIVSHLKAYAGEVLETEGIEWLLYEWAHTRDIYHEMYPAEGNEWVGEREAMEVTGRSARTLRRWRESGNVRVLHDGGPLQFNSEDLLLMCRIKAENEQRGKTLGQPVV